MKKLLVVVVLGFITTSKTFAYNYCDAYLKSSKPLDNPTMTNIVLLETELKCLGKIKEASMFQEQMYEMMEKHLDEWVKIMYDSDENDKIIAKQMQQEYISSVVRLFYKLKDN